MLLLERDFDLDNLDAALREVKEDNGRVALVYGEAGIGKTSLVERFVDLRRRSARVIWGRCDSLSTPQPLGPLYDMAAQLEGEWRTLLHAGADRLAVFAGFLRAMGDGAHPTIAVVEDVHWADAATLDLLKYLGRRLQGVKALMILTYRNDEIDREHPLWSVIGNLPSRMVRHLPLSPLSKEAVATLAGQDSQPAGTVHALTGGNPFFVSELLAHPDGGLPATIREATLARAVGLSPAARMLLDLSSVVPNRMERWLLEAALAPAPSEIDECVRTGLLVMDNDVLHFRHDLARQAVEGTLPVARAQALHARILQALLDHCPDGEPLARIVHHAACARDNAVVRRYAPAAARQAAALGAHREAAAHYKTALEVADQADLDGRASLLECRAYESYLTDQIEPAIEAMRQALVLQRKQDRPIKVGEDLRWLSRFFWCLGRHGEAVEHGEASISILERLPPGPEVAMAYSNRAQLHMLAHESREAVHWGHRALDPAGQLALPEVRIHALNNVGAAELQLGDGQGWVDLEQSLELALQHDMHEHAARAYCNLSWQALAEHEYARSERYIADGLSYTTERELDSWNSYLLSLRARAHLEQGRLQQAADDAEMVLRSCRAPLFRFVALVALGTVRVRRGDPGGESLLDEALTLALQTGEAMRIAPTAAARAEAAWLKGRPAEACEEARRGYDLASSKGDAHLAGPPALWLWRAGGASAITTRTAAPFDIQIKGDWERAAAEWHRLGCPYEEALALADGDCFARLRALAILDRLGAVPAAAILRRGLRAQGVRRIPRGPRPATKRNPAGLTAREMSILGLLGEGLSNRVIAGRLSISEKTVDHHVSSVLAKLGTGTRLEAVSQATVRGLIAQDREAPAPK